MGNNDQINALIRAAARPKPEPPAPAPTAPLVLSDAADAAAGAGYADSGRRRPKNMSALIRSAAHPERD